MNWRLGTAIGATLLLAACGDDGGESADQAELSGVLEAGNVNGVSYRTPTRDGVTDASGTFKYLAGETVTFSIGGIQLGRAQGSAAVTPFTLAGMTPPTTEPALRRELDRASRYTSNFVRAVNMDRLLLALDADHNPANGIDVRGRENVLANATIDFDQPIAQFAARLEKLTPNLTHNIPRWFPVVHLYRSVGIEVPVHAPVLYEYDDAFFSNRQSLITYYPDGSLESQSSVDSFAGGLYSSAYAYDALGRTTTLRITNQPVFVPLPTYMEEERWTYDARGTPTANIREFDQSTDGTIDFSWSASFEFDAFNNLLRQVSRNDTGNDGITDGLDDYRATYDARLNRVRTVSESDTDVNGTIDTRYEYTAEYDSRNRVTAQQVEWDGEADGVVDQRESITVTFSDNGPGVVQIYERDNGADGDVDVIYTYRQSYDSSGGLRTLDLLQEQDANADGVTDQRIRQVVTYDRDGHPLSEVTHQDWDGNPGDETIVTRTFTYTAFGSPLRVIRESDAGADGVPDSRYTTQYEYGAGGELMSYVNSSAQSPNWIPAPAGSTQVTSVLMVDGVRMLAQQYFEPVFSPDVAIAF